MIRLVIAMMLGAVLASGGVAITNTFFLTHVADGSPSTASINQYGNR